MKNKDKEIQKPHKKEKAIVRSSAAEYLTFVAAGGGSEASVEMRYEDENIWLTQKMMATLYDVSVPAINQHLKRIFADNELTREATVKQYLIVQTEGSREVRREVEHYNLQAIIAVGFKIENERAVQFRKWANQIVKDYTIQGWTMDVKRLLLLFELPCVQMPFLRSRLLFDAALQIETTALQMPGQLGLQLFQTFPRIDFIRVQPIIRRHRNMQEVHMRRFFIHVNHCGYDVFRADKLCQERLAFLKKAFGILR